MDFSSKERRTALIQMRLRRSWLIHHEPHKRQAIKNNAAAIDALERILVLDLGGQKDEKKKDEKDKSES
jgi:hypothetical protein